MATVTQRWSEWRWQRGVNGELVFDVIDASTEEEARAAIPYQAGNIFPVDTSLRATEPMVERNGPGSTAWVVRAFFTRDAIVTDSTVPRFSFYRGSYSEATDQDVDGNALMNSVADPFDGLTEEYPVFFFKVTRKEPNPNINTMVAYTNAVNDDVFTLPVLGTIDKGRCRCEHYMPVEEFTADSVSDGLVMEYLFQLRGGGRQLDDGMWDVFMRRLVDKGLRAAGQDSDGGAAIVEIVDLNEDPVTTPVLLDGKGRILDPNKYHLKGEYMSLELSTPIGATLENTGDAVFLKYHRSARLPFSALFLF